MLVVLTACRSEKTVYLSDRLQAEVKKPPAGMIQLLGASTTVSYQGRTIVSAPSLYYLDFGDSIAIRDDGRRGVIMVRHDGSETDLPCGGMAVAPERFPGIDCWAGGAAADFDYKRFAASGQVVSNRKAPKVVTDCGGRQRIDYMGYDQRGEPVVGYECTVDGTRMCRAITLDDEAKLLEEMPATTPDVSCGYLLRTEKRLPLTDVRRWTLVGE